MRAIWDYKTGSSLQLLIFSCKAILANTRVHCTCRLISSPFTDIWRSARIACIYVKPHVVRGSRTLGVFRDAQWDRWNARFARCSEKKESRTWKEGSAPPERGHRFFIEVLLRWLLLIKCSISVVQHSFLYVFLWVIKPQRCLSW